MSGIIAVGSLNMDLSITTARVPAMGETVLGEKFMTSPLGKGANQAVSAAKLGGQVTMIGCVGNDIFGNDLIDNLMQNNVGTEPVRRTKDISTGIAMITVKDGNNSIIVDPGANYHLSAEMIKENEGIIKTGGIMLKQLEIPIEAVEEAVRIAKANHVIVLLNPAPARELSDGLLSKIDIITPNETECEAITGIKISGPDDAQKAVLQLMGNRLTCSLYYYIRLMSNNMACPFGQA